MQALVGPAGDHVGGHLDLREVRLLARPVFVLERVGEHHVGHRLDLAARVLQPVVLPEGGEVRGDAAVEGELAVDIAQPLAGVDRGEARGAQRRGPPLRDGEVGDAGHPDLAVRPRPRRRPGDHVGDVARLALIPDGGELSAGPPGAARIDVHHGVAVRAPARRIGPLEGRVVGDPLGLDTRARASGLVLELGIDGAAVVLPVRAPGDQHGHVVCATGRNRST